jgi:hypothetical protein
MRILILLLPLFISCQSVINLTKHGNMELSCIDSIKFVKLIEATIELPNLQQYLESQEKMLNQKELVILNSSRYLSDADKLTKFNNPVKLMNDIEIKNKNIIAYLEYEEINIKNDSAYVYYRYSIHGIGMESAYVLKDCEWELVTTHLWEN